MIQAKNVQQKIGAIAEKQAAVSGVYTWLEMLIKNVADRQMIEKNHPRYVCSSVIFKFLYFLKTYPR